MTDFLEGNNLFNDLQSRYPELRNINNAVGYSGIIRVSTPILFIISAGQSLVLKAIEGRRQFEITLTHRGWNGKYTPRISDGY